MTNAVFMPYVLAFNRPVIEEKFERLAGFLGLEGGFDGVLERGPEAARGTGVPNTLAGLNVDGAQAARSPRWPSSTRPPAAIRWS
jgi:alcohol dehydrogenase class IV